MHSVRMTMNAPRDGLSVHRLWITGVLEPLDRAAAWLVLERGAPRSAVPHFAVGAGSALHAGTWAPPSLSSGPRPTRP